jgi:hypothetical protein
MEAFDIHITLEAEPQTLRVQPLDELREDKHQYQVFRGEELLGTVWPDLLDEGIRWNSDVEIDGDTLFAIGEAIEKHDY